MLKARLRCHLVTELSRQGIRFAPHLNARRQPGRSAIVIGAAMQIWQRSRDNTTPSPPDVSAALRRATEASRAASAKEDGDRGHRVWQNSRDFTNRPPAR
jgi:hypothetical protein